MVFKWVKKDTPPLPRTNFLLALGDWCFQQPRNRRNIKYGTTVTPRHWVSLSYNKKSFNTMSSDSSDAWPLQPKKTTMTSPENFLGLKRKFSIFHSIIQARNFAVIWLYTVSLLSLIIRQGIRRNNTETSMHIWILDNN